MPDALSRIEHFVVLMLENRSFDHMLGWMKSENAAIEGLTGTETNPVSPGDPQSPTIGVTTTAGFGDPDLDPGHDLGDTTEQLFGVNPAPARAAPANSGFLASYAKKRQSAGQAADGSSLMRCFAPASLPVLATLAREFALCDHWFSSVPGPTWPNRFFVHCGWSGGHYDNKFRLYGMRTIYEELEARKCSWRIYYIQFPHSLLLTHLHDPVRARNFEPLGRFYVAAAKGKLPNYTFIEPDYFGDDANDQHPPHDVRHGERLIASIYDALRQSPAWDKTLLVMTYDEHGGLYDHVAPPAGPQYIPNPKHDKGFDFSRLGVRVPTILVSPYIPRGTVDHAVYDHTSILATVTTRFGLPGKLSARVGTANTFEANLSLSIPRSDAPATVTPAAVSQALQAARPVPTDLPLSEFQESLVGAARRLDARRAGRAGPGARKRGAAAALAAAAPLTRKQAERYVSRVRTAVLAQARKAAPAPRAKGRGRKRR